MENLKNVAPIEDFNWDAYENGESVASASHEELEKAYDNTLNKVNDREVVDGTVIAMNKREVVVNIGYKSDGIIPMSEFRYNPELKVGDTVEVYIENQEDKIYIAGHSAGGYLSLMLNLDKSYLAKWNIDANNLAGAFPISGQTTTHYTIRKERGLPSDTPIIDKYAPSNNVRKDASPMILITGDKELEMLARYEENAHLYALLKALGQNTVLYQMEGFDHGTVAAPACTLINSYMKKAGKK
jgi:hypothetical protein